MFVEKSYLFVTKKNFFLFYLNIREGNADFC